MSDVSQGRVRRVSHGYGGWPCRALRWALAWLPLVVHAAAPVLIETPDGTVVGRRDSGYAVYKGIPFAQPPVGDLRWRPPVAVRPRHRVLQATRFKPMCMTSAPAIPGGKMDPVSEDCLYLNVWTPPHATAGDRLPVMVLIYGGGLRAGSASSPLYWGEQLVQKGVITVNISYRGGSFGFLSHPDLSRESGHGTSGDYGVLDMIEALRWVQRNIAAFGGDPRRVALWGHSAGSFAVGYLMTSPLSRGLFSAAIAQSGADMDAPEPYGGGMLSPELAEASGVRWAARLHAGSIEALRHLPARQLEAADARWPENAAGRVKGNGASGSIAVLDDFVFPLSIYEALARHQQAKVPLLLGHTDNEAASYHEPVAAAEYEAFVRKRFGAYGDAMLTLYPASDPAAVPDPQLALARDDGYGWHMWTWARLQAADGGSPVYLYDFAFAPQQGAASDVHPIAAHGYELGYVFHHPRWLSTGAAAPLARQEMEVMSTYWTNFAKTGDPNGPGLPDWPRFTPLNPMRMVFDEPNRAEPISDQARARLALLDGYYALARARQAPQRVQ